MNILFWILGIIGAIVVIVVIYIQISTWIDDYSEKKYWRKRKEAFRFVYAQLFDCKYWIDQPGHKPYKEFYEWIMDKMISDGNIKGEEIRAKVAAIIEANKDHELLTSKH